MRLRHDLLLLALAGAALFFGGGIGCDPELDGTKLRIDSVAPFGYFMGINGSKAPGSAWLEMSYPSVPSFGITARVGVFLDEKGPATHDASIGVGFRKSDLTDSYEIRARYEYTPTVKLFLSSNLDGTTAECAPGVLRAELQIGDEAGDVVASYRCEGQTMFSELTSVASRYDAGERWFPYVAASNLMKGGQVAFDDLRLNSAGPFAMTPEAETAWQTFQGFGNALEAFYSLELGDQNDAQLRAEDAFNDFDAAFEFFDLDLVSFSSAAEKLWFKGGKGFLKSSDALFTEKPDKYFKGAPKFLDAFACSLYEMEPDL
jgi:hypothetical protein